ARASFESRPVVFRPPVDKLSVAVVLRTLIIESVTNLVPDHCTDPAVVGCGIPSLIEERKLQNRGGKHDLVEPGVVIGVHGLRSHEPLIAIKRFADLSEFTRELE